MVSSDVKVLGTMMCPYANPVEIALNLKSVDYEFREETFPSKSGLLLKSNPVHKKIPVMVHGGKPNESLIIVQYIDGAWTGGPSILPLDPYDRATALFWAAYVDDKKNYDCRTNFHTVPMHDIMHVIAQWWPTLNGLQKAEGEEEKVAATEQFVDALMPLDNALAKCGKGKDFFGGDTIGYVDIALGSFLGWLRAVEKMSDSKLLDKTTTPSLFGWAERFVSNADAKDVILEADKIVKMVATLAKAQ